MFQIVSHKVEITTNQFETEINEAINRALQTKIDMINDPKELVDDLEFENFSISHLEASFKKLMKKVDFKLPAKLYVPVTNFVISNYMANTIKVTQTGLTYEYDPRSLGLLSEKVKHFLVDIKHPFPSEEVPFDYSLTMDQNILNSLLMEVAMTHQTVSLRKLMSLFDKQLYFIKMMSTNLL